jgi:hypothetical protein
VFGPVGLIKEYSSDIQGNRRTLMSTGAEAPAGRG